MAFSLIVIECAIGMYVSHSFVPEQALGWFPLGLGLVINLPT